MREANAPRIQGSEDPSNSKDAAPLQFNESITMIGFHWRLSSGKNVRHNEWHRAKTLGAVERRLRPSCISRQHGNAIYKPGQESWLTGSLNPAESAGPLLLMPVAVSWRRSIGISISNGGIHSIAIAIAITITISGPTRQDALFGVEFNFSLTL